MKLPNLKPPITIIFIFALILHLGACRQNSGEVTQLQAHSDQQQESYWVYVSSGSEDGADSGIGIYEWVPEKGELTAIAGVTEVGSSSYLALDPETEKLYSINNDGIQAFRIDVNTGGLELLNQIDNAGRGGCHLSISNDHQFLLAAYYSSGSVASYKLHRDGSIGQPISVIQHQGSSVNKERQEGPHAHMILPAPTGNLVFAPDLGTDKVMAYQISQEGALTPAPLPFVSLNPGYGPRHMVFHPHQPFAYVLAELTGHVVGFKFDVQQGLGQKINDLSTLPNDFSDNNKSADIHISLDGKYLYASNRGPNSLAIFSINQETGQLTLLGILSCEGDWPRAFGIDPSGKYLLIANKNSNAISLQKINDATGLFEAAGNVNTVKAPQCIRFIKRS